MDDACDLCGSTRLLPRYAPATKRGLTVHECESCGLVQSLPRIAHIARRQIEVSAGADWGNVRYGKAFRTASNLALLEKHVDLSRGLHVLDVGSNRGSFTRAFLERSPRSHVVCVEPDDRLIADYEGLENLHVFPRRIEDVRLHDQSFDVIHSCHTLEHLASPRATLVDHARTIKTGGILLIDAPNLEFIRGDDIVEEWFIDKHLYHFTSLSLERMVLSAGFEILELVVTDENLQIIARRSSIITGLVPSIATYAEKLERNRGRLRSAAAKLTDLAPDGLAVWGAGRLFGALVEYGGFDPSCLKLLIDAPLKAHVPERFGVKLAGPEELASVRPARIVVMSRAFADEIAADIAARLPTAEVMLYRDLTRSL